MNAAVLVGLEAVEPAQAEPPGTAMDSTTTCGEVGAKVATADAL